MRTYLLGLGFGLSVLLGTATIVSPPVTPALVPDMGVNIPDPVRMQSCKSDSDCPEPQACVDNTCSPPAEHVAPRHGEMWARWPGSGLR